MKVSIVKVKDLRSSIKKSVDLIGGFRNFIKKGDRVLIKPNFNSDDPFPASSDPGFIRETIGLIREAGAEEVVIGESSGPYWKPTTRTLKKTGLLKMAEEMQVEVLDFDHLPFVYKEMPKTAKYLKGLHVPESLFKYDKLIYLPCLKTHSWARFTLSLKLSMGFPRQMERFKMHAINLEPKLAELNLLMKPDLIIMDGRKCFVTGGPSKGKVESPKVILASEDRVAIDIEGVKIIQSYKARNRLDLPPEELPMIKHAIRLGIGEPGDVVRKSLE